MNSTDRDKAMKTYETYVKIRAARREAESWMANSRKIDSQCSKPYSLTGLKFSAEYCGQAYAGANNYHKSPSDFNQAMQEVIAENFSALSAKALSKMMERERLALIACEDEVASVQADIAAAKETA